MDTTTSRSDPKGYDPFRQKTAHSAVRDLEPGAAPTVGDLRAMFQGTRIPNSATVRFERDAHGIQIIAEWKS